MKKRLPKIADWPAFLAAWGEKAKEPRREGAPKVVSTFAGCGGSSTGYRMAGFDVVLATDWWDVAGRTYRKNWPDCRYLIADITKMDGRDVLKETGLDVGELDLLDGSPPCQGFSTAGKRILDDPRNSLFLDFCRLLETMKPKTFVMENVSGLVRGKMRIMFREMTSELKSKGYDVSCRMLNASWLGVPQARERIIWVGIRNDFNILPIHPNPRYQQISVATAIGIDCGNGKITGGAFPSWSDISRPSPTLRAAGPASVEIDGVKRKLEIWESKRIQTFLDWYNFVGNNSEIIKQIGNAVPPLMAAHVALAMSEELFRFPAVYVDPDISDDGSEF